MLVYSKRKWIITNEDDQNNILQRLAKMKLVQSFLVLFRATKLLHYNQSFPHFLTKEELLLSNSNFISIFEIFLNAEYTLQKFFQMIQTLIPIYIQYSKVRARQSYKGK